MRNNLIQNKYKITNIKFKKIKSKTEITEMYISRC